MQQTGCNIGREENTTPEEQHCTMAAECSGTNGCVIRKERFNESKAQWFAPTATPCLKRNKATHTYRNNMWWPPLEGARPTRDRISIANPHHTSNEETSLLKARQRTTTSNYQNFTSFALGMRRDCTRYWRRPRQNWLGCGAYRKNLST
jgi:hypothetical protein